MATWKRYEYVVIDQPYLSTLEPRRINYLEDDIPISEFMGKLQNHIYKYIRHSHRSRWQASKFKHSHEVFKPGTILSVVDFAEHYIFSPQRKIHSEYYHLDQVSIFIHVLYRHAQVSVDSVDNTPESHNVIKEYHFYISDDRAHDTFFVQNCFGLIYESLKKTTYHSQSIGFGQAGVQGSSSKHIIFIG